MNKYETGAVTGALALAEAKWVCAMLFEDFPIKELLEPTVEE